LASLETEPLSSKEAVAKAQEALAMATAKNENSLAAWDAARESAIRERSEAQQAQVQSLFSATVDGNASANTDAGAMEESATSAITSEEKEAAKERETAAESKTAEAKAEVSAAEDALVQVMKDSPDDEAALADVKAELEKAETRELAAEQDLEEAASVADPVKAEQVAEEALDATIALSPDDVDAIKEAQAKVEDAKAAVEEEASVEAVNESASPSGSPVCDHATLTAIGAAVEASLVDKPRCLRMMEDQIAGKKIEPKTLADVDLLCRCYYAVPDEVKEANDCRPTPASTFTVAEMAQGVADDMCENTVALRGADKSDLAASEDSIGVDVGFDELESAMSFDSGSSATGGAGEVASEGESEVSAEVSSDEDEDNAFGATLDELSMGDVVPEIGDSESIEDEAGVEVAMAFSGVFNADADYDDLKEYVRDTCVKATGMSRSDVTVLDVHPGSIIADISFSGHLTLLTANPTMLEDELQKTFEASASPIADKYGKPVVTAQPRWVKTERRLADCRKLELEARELSKKKEGDANAAEAHGNSDLAAAAENSVSLASSSADSESRRCEELVAKVASEKEIAEVARKAGEKALTDPAAFEEEIRRIALSKSGHNATSSGNYVHKAKPVTVQEKQKAQMIVESVIENEPANEDDGAVIDLTAAAGAEFPKNSGGRAQPIALWSLLLAMMCGFVIGL